MTSLALNNSETSAKYSITDIRTTILDTEDHETSDNLDFIGTSRDVKSLFLLPYATSQSISVAVHNLRGTLLIDSDPGEQPFPNSDDISRTSSSEKCVGSNQANVNEKDTDVDDGLTESLVVAGKSYEGTREAMELLNSVISSSNKLDSDRRAPKNVLSNDPFELDTFVQAPVPETFAYKYIPESPEPREYLTWQFRDMNMLIGSEALIYRSTNDSPTAISVRVEEASTMKALLRQHQQMVQSGSFIVDHQYPKFNQVNKHSYAEAARKSFRLEQLATDKIEETQSTENFQYTLSSKHIDDHFYQVSSLSTPNFDNLHLKTCVVSSDTKDSVGRDLTDFCSNNLPDSSASNVNLSPVSTVLDTYLDNIMANVPQLALCLQEKGFIQSVKLLDTTAIPSRLMNSATFDTSMPYEIISKASPEDEIFSPQIMEMNAATLLRFLKANCTKDNATYLMRREAGRTNIQLYDISSISARRQRKWLWWLAMMSYRFAIRLRNVASITKEKALRRNFRDRQRSLLQNTLDLLEAVSDLNGSAHESLVAAVTENLADTFLCSTDEDEEEKSTTTKIVPSTVDSENVPKSPPPAISISSYQPYRKASTDALCKAQDRLATAIKVLWPVLESKLRISHSPKDVNSKDSKHCTIQRNEHPDGKNSIESSSSDDESEEQSQIEAPLPSTEQLMPIATQLIGLHRKLIDVSLRLVEIHLKNYHSSSAMQSLRIAARRMADSLYLSGLFNENFHHNVFEWEKHLQLQFIWLWEHCGHFARSFASDNLWRDRGHASGDDVISVLQDVEVAFSSKERPLTLKQQYLRSSFLMGRANGMLSLQEQELSGVVLVPSKGLRRMGYELYRYKDEESGAAFHFADAILRKQKTLQRDRRKVLVAACICYSIAIDAFGGMLTKAFELTCDHSLLKLMYQRHGDACNEVGKMMLDELRILLKSLNEGKCEVDSGIYATEPLLVSAEFWFVEALDTFKKICDLRNVALLECNLCQCYKLRANNTFAAISPMKSLGAAKKPTAVDQNAIHAETCLQESVNHLLSAHQSLGERQVDPATWDMVSDELAATYLVLGVRRRQTLIGSGNIPMVATEPKLTQGQERSITDPMERSLNIYADMGNFHQAAAANYQLALFYSKIWTCQRDQAKTREKLSNAFNHYYSAFGYFSRSLRGNEATFCLLCIDLSNLYSVVSGKEGLIKALKCCLDTANALSDESIELALSKLGTRTEWFEQMDTISKTIEDRTFKLLRGLIKLEADGNVSVSDTTQYKDLYRVGLQAKLKSTSITTLIQIGDNVFLKQANQLTQLRYILKEVKSQLPAATKEGRL